MLAFEKGTIKKNFWSLVRQCIGYVTGRQLFTSNLPAFVFDLGPVVILLDAVDVVIYKVCPFVAAGVVVGSIYWTAVTYGAVTVMQVNTEILQQFHLICKMNHAQTFTNTVLTNI